jgi:hypothetical protein
VYSSKPFQTVAQRGPFRREDFVAPNLRSATIHCSVRPLNSPQAQGQSIQQRHGGSPCRGELSFRQETRVRKYGCVVMSIGRDRGQTRKPQSGPLTAVALRAIQLRHRPITLPRVNELEGKGKWSGRKDLNLRPPGPEPGALARLRYAPTDTLRRKSSRSANTSLSQQMRRIYSRSGAAHLRARCYTNESPRHKANPESTQTQPKNETAGENFSPRRSVFTRSTRAPNLELVAQRELHRSRVGQQAGVVSKRAAVGDRSIQRRNVESR